MPRYIDATKLEELCDIMADKCDGGTGESIWNQFRTTVEWSPTADVVEVVRCKDCVWYDERRPYANGHTLYECRNLERFLPPDFFCKDGERRDDVQIH